MDSSFGIWDHVIKCFDKLFQSHVTVKHETINIEPFHRGSNRNKLEITPQISGIAMNVIKIMIPKKWRTSMNMPRHSYVAISRARAQ